MIKFSTKTSTNPISRTVLLVAVLVLVVLLAFQTIKPTNVVAIGRCPGDDSTEISDGLDSSIFTCRDGAGNVCTAEVLLASGDEFGLFRCPAYITPSNTDDSTSGSNSEYNIAYQGASEEFCNSLAVIEVPDNIDNLSDEQKAYLEKEQQAANNRKASCLYTISQQLDACNKDSYGADCVKTVPIFETFLQIVNFLAAGVGLFVTTMIVFNGIRYAAARDNPQQVAAARSGIINALIALFVFIFMYAFLQWLIPGGIF